MDRKNNYNITKHLLFTASALFMACDCSGMSSESPVQRNLRRTNKAAGAVGFTLFRQGQLGPAVKKMGRNIKDSAMLTHLRTQVSTLKLKINAAIKKIENNSESHYQQKNLQIIADCQKCVDAINTEIQRVRKNEYNSHSADDLEYRELQLNELRDLKEEIKSKLKKLDFNAVITDALSDSDS